MKRQYKPAKAESIKMRHKGDKCGTIPPSIGMSIGMVRRIIQNEISQAEIGITPGPIEELIYD